MIKNIVFDIGMVLVDFAWEATMRELNFSEECIRTLADNLIDHSTWDRFDLGAQREEDVLDEVCKKIPKYEKEIRLFYDNLLMTIRPYDYCEKWVREMKERGLNTYLLTNYPESLFEKSIESGFPFYPYIDGKVVSSHVKAIKPDEKIYKCLFEKYDLKPEECIFFDDREKNIKTARNLGMNAFVFEGYDKAMEIVNSLID